MCVCVHLKNKFFKLINHLQYENRIYFWVHSKFNFILFLTKVSDSSSAHLLRKPKCLFQQLWISIFFSSHLWLCLLNIFYLHMKKISQIWRKHEPNVWLFFCYFIWIYLMIIESTWNSYSKNYRLQLHNL